MVLYLKKISVGVDGEVVPPVLYNVMEGVDGSAAFGLSVEKRALAVADNQEFQYAHDYVFDIRVLSGSTGDAALQVIQSDYALQGLGLVRVTGISEDGFMLFRDPMLMQSPPQYDNVYARRLYTTLTTTPGYAGTAPLRSLPVYVGSNALFVYDVESGSASLLNGMTTSGTITTSVSGAAQTVTRAADASAYLASRNIFMPFAGQQITASAFVASANAGYTLGFRFTDIDGAEISVSTASETGATSRKSHTAVIPANTAFVQFYVAPGATAANSVTFQYPAIRLGTNATYSL